MRRLHLVGFTTDRKGLIFSARRGSKSGGYVVPIEQGLIESISSVQGGDDAVDDRSPADNGDARGRPESTLTPREMQARLRAGRSIAEVAAEAQVDPEWVSRFAVPILAEQAQMVELARSLTYDKPRRGRSAEPLDTSVAINLADRGVVLPEDAFDSAWSAYQLHDVVWVVRLRYRSRGRAQEASWEVNVADGHLTSRNRLASELGYVDGGRRRRPPARVAAADDAEADGPLAGGRDGLAEPSPGGGRKAPARSRRTAAAPAARRRRTSAARASGPRARKAPATGQSPAKRPPARATAKATTNPTVPTAAKKAAGAPSSRTTARTTAAKKTTAANKTTGAKKAAPKKTAARRAAPKKAAPKKAPPKAAPKKAAPKKAAPKKAAPKKDAEARPRSPRLAGARAVPLDPRAANPPASVAVSPATAAAAVPDEPNRVAVNRMASGRVAASRAEAGRLAGDRRPANPVPPPEPPPLRAAPRASRPAPPAAHAGDGAAARPGAMVTPPPEASEPGDREPIAAGPVEATAAASPEPTTPGPPAPATDAESFEAPAYGAHAIDAEPFEIDDLLDAPPPKPVGRKPVIAAERAGRDTPGTPSFRGRRPSANPWPVGAG